MSSCSGGDDGGGGDDGFPSPGAGARAVAQQSALQDAIHSIAQTVGQMQETMMTMIRKMERTDETVRGVERRLTQQGEMVAKMGSRMSELDRSLHEAKGRAAPPHNERGLAFSDGGPSLQNAPRSAVPDGRASSQNELRPGYECPPAFCHAHRSTPSLPHIRDPPTQASSQCGTLDPVPVQPHHNGPREANPKARSSSQSLYRPPPPTQQRMASPDTGHSPPPSIFQLLPSIRCSSSSSGHQSSREARSPSLDVGHEPPQQQKYRHSDCWLGDFILHKNRSKSPSDRCSASPRAHCSSPFDPRSTLPQDRSSLSLQESSLRSQAGYCWGTQSEFRSLSPDTVPHDGRSQTPQEQRTHTSDDNRSPAKSVCGARERLNSSESSDEDRSSRGKLSVSADGRSKSTEDDLSAERAPSQPGRVCRLEAAHEARFQAPAGSALHLGCCKASDDPLGNRHLPPPPALRRSPPADVHYTPPIVQYKSDSSTSTSYSTDDSSAASDSLGSRCRRRRRRARSSGATSAASTRTRTPGAAARAQGSSCSSTTSRSSASASASASPSVASRPPPPGPAAAMPKRDSFTSVRSVCTSVAPVRAGAAVLRPRPRPPPTLASAIPPPAPSTPRPRPFAPPRQCASSSPTRAPAPAPAAAHGPASAPAAAPADHEEAARVAALGRYLLAAAHDGKADEVRMLLNAGADVNYSNSLKWTALHKAAAKAHAAVVALLLRRGADAAAATCYGFTPLHIATYNDRSGQCVVRLIAAGAGLERANRSGRTPLHTAVESGNVAAMLALLAAGADRHHKDEEGKTPMDVAKTFCVKRLLRSTERRERKPKAKRCRTQPSVSAADAPAPAPALATGLAPAHGYVSE